MLSGDTAKQIFERAQLPNEVLGRIWNLADTEGRGALGITEFTIAMHLLASYKSGSLTALPQILPPGLFEAAARRGAPPRQMSGSRPTSDGHPVSAVSRQFSGAAPQRTSSPLTRPPYVAPQGQPPGGPRQQASLDWVVSPHEKAQFDTIFSKVDTTGRGSITGDQAVGFFSNSRLPEDDLAQIWDLADINSEGQLSRDEFAVAMYLIRQQLNKKGQGVLPQSLPLNLVPPSLRKQPIAPQQSTAPAFDNAANITQSKSAADDLFGLDDFSAPAPLAPQTTSGSTNHTSSSPQTPSSPLKSQPPSLFKPFIPSSSFGQAIMTPQATGSSASPVASQSRGLQQPHAPEDLLGDNDPEVSKRLTNETSELANLSNQVGSLTNQMQQVKTNRGTTERELSQVNTQKRDFETRLAQLRSAYEQEVKEVKVIEDRLATSRNDTKRLQQEMALIDGSHQDLQGQHKQVIDALETDQRENASLKERIRQVNTEITQLKTQLEKTRSDARQQKGLVAINRKQLSTNETEKEKATGELTGASKELDDVTREVAESNRSAQPISSTQTPAAVASPAASVSSMNPFFKRSTTASSDRGLGAPAFSPAAATSPNHTAFDSFFGPALPANSISPGPSQPSGPPQTTFKSDRTVRSPEPLESSEQASHSVPSSDGAEVMTPSASPPPPHASEPGEVVVPPPPPQSRQITSSALPFRSELQRADSTSSSVKVVPPASNQGTPRSQPLHSREISQPLTLNEPFQPGGVNEIAPIESDFGQIPSINPPFTPSATPSGDLHRPADISTAGSAEEPMGLGQISAPPNVPGAFPGDYTPAVQTPFATGNQVRNEDGPGTRTSTSTRNDEDPFSMNSGQVKDPASAKDDFDSVFAGLDKPTAPTERGTAEFPSHGFNDVPKPTARGEFPPIQEFGPEEDSDSDTDRGFEDSFTSHQNPATEDHVPQHMSGHQTGPVDFSGSAQPALDTRLPGTDQLPQADAQKSPPTYDQTMSPPGEENVHRGSNQFPAAYDGLLPSRENPTSSPMSSPPISSEAPETFISSPHYDFSEAPPFSTSNGKQRSISGSQSALTADQMPMPPGHTAAPYAYDQHPNSASQMTSPPAAPAKTAFDDFDNEFGDLSEAKEGEDDFVIPHKDGFDDFNPNFDPPAPNPSAVGGDLAQPMTGMNQSKNSDAFRDFESSIGGGTASTTQQQQTGSVSQSHDWDAIFAGLDGDGQSSGGNVASHQSNGGGGAFSQEPGQIAGHQNLQASKPPFGRAMSTGTEHDDPILKRLTGMGYARDESLQALERFDYNIDKVS